LVLGVIALRHHNRGTGT